ncbi:MAG: prepilin-type N-terminal cleavage/methylation domain-containing protein, partial [Oscillospiraceae bacterium]|nr:prepilin-type N-terminal cleavage/methylation domain-containing protein [Oscillospiraceae bacterium]
MSKIFSKRSGFTLVEIIVAFAVFAIMAAMLVSLTGLAVRQRQSNLDFSRELSNQQAYLASHERETTYNSAYKGGQFEFDFPGVSSASLDYSVVPSTADATAEGGRTYIVAAAHPKAQPVV